MGDRLSYEEKKELPDSIRAAEAYFRYCPEELKPKLAKEILKRAKEYGVDVESETVREYATRK